MKNARTRLPLIFLGIMTIMTLLGPVLIAWVLSGGKHSTFPPDRPIEWVAFVGVCAIVTALMIACVTMGMANGRVIRDHQAKAETKP